MKTERLDKILTHHGYGSRKDVKKLLHDQRVQINGVMCLSPETHIDTDVDIISIDNKDLEIRRNIYLMLNKCQGVVCSTKDGVHKTVIDLVPKEYLISLLGGELHPIGRLDIDTEGLLLLTTDGTLTHRLTSPKNHIPKTYLVHLRDAIDEEKQIEYSKLFAEGLDIPPEANEDGFISKPAELVWPSAEGCDLLETNGPLADQVLITITEGKYHQVKRMFSKVGNEVVYLKRVSIGTLQLDSGLKLGECRELRAEELELL